MDCCGVWNALIAACCGCWCECRGLSFRTRFQSWTLVLLCIYTKKSMLMFLTAAAPTGSTFVANTNTPFVFCQWPCCLPVVSSVLLRWNECDRQNRRGLSFPTDKCSINFTKNQTTLDYLQRRVFMFVGHNPIRFTRADRPHHGHKASTRDTHPCAA